MAPAAAWKRRGHGRGRGQVAAARMRKRRNFGWAPEAHLGGRAVGVHEKRAAVPDDRAERLEPRDEHPRSRRERRGGIAERTRPLQERRVPGVEVPEQPGPPAHLHLHLPRVALVVALDCAEVARGCDLRGRRAGRREAPDQPRKTPGRHGGRVALAERRVHKKSVNYLRNNRVLARDCCGHWHRRSESWRPPRRSSRPRRRRRGYHVRVLVVASRVVEIRVPSARRSRTRRTWRHHHRDERSRGHSWNRNSQRRAKSRRGGPSRTRTIPPRSPQRSDPPRNPCDGPWFTRDPSRRSRASSPTPEQTRRR